MVAKEALDFFENYFNHEYQFPKLDLVPIPSFAMGAMENWGLVTFRRSSLLFNDKKDTTLAKLRVAETVCHEIAHMWFGNLVTMAWWNDLWLNEGFATWASFMALNNISEKLIDLDVWTNFINDNLERGMIYDALHSSHPIAVNVKEPSEISQIFDSISYSKGASIIRMMETYIGHNAFRENIQKYLSTHKLKNAVSSDLFEHTPSSELSIKMLDSWIKQEGFPIIKVAEKDGFIELQQTRFLSGQKNNGDKTWIIPITVAYTDKDPKKYIMDKKILKIKLDSNNYKINFSSTGVYRVLYNEKTFESILKSKFSPKEKLNIINDMFSLAFGGYLKIKWTLDTIKTNLDVTNYDILKSILNNTSKLFMLYNDDQKSITYLEEFLTAIFSPLYKNFDLNKKEGKMSDRLKNSIILSSSLLVKDEKMLEDLKKNILEYKKGKIDINPDYLQTMLNAMVDDNIDWVIELYKTTKNATIRTNSARALGAVHKIENLDRVLKNYTLVDRQDFIYFMRGLSLNYKFKNNIVNFFMNNFEEIREYLNNESILNSLIESVFCDVSNDELRNKVESFISNLKIPESDMSIRKINEMNYNLSQFKKANENPFY
jgi:puromycin-sensitive aminopeptidase